MKKLLVIPVAVIVLASCSKDKDPIIIVPPSSGSTLTLDGGTGGASAVNSVFVDFSADKQVSVKRDSWDLAFYCGSDFRVTLNNTVSATAKVTNKTDINTVGIADSVGLNKLALGYDPSGFALIDDVSGDITKTLIPAVSASESDNKVVIINPGSLDNKTPRDWYKIRVQRKGTGYTLQYAKLDATSFQTIDVAKDNMFNFKYVSFTTGITVVEPETKNWDIRWSVIQNKTPLSATVDIPYAKSDFVIINTSNVQAFQRTYENTEAATAAYTKFNKDSVGKYSFSGNRDVIGENWRKVNAPPAKSFTYFDRFFIIKDGSGNIYKLKFISFHPDEGSERGKPQLKYELIK